MSKGGAKLDAIQGSWLANAATAIFIAVVAGVVVWWLTKPESYQPSLSYQVTRTGDFSNQGGKLNFFTVELVNRGSNVANGVTLNLKPSISLASIEETAVTTSRTRPPLTFSKVGSQRLLTVPRLKPTERVKVSLAVSSQGEVDLEVVGAAENASLAQIVPNDQEALRDNPFVLFLVVSGALGGNALAVALIRRRIFKRTRSAYLFADKNNIAFLLMHSGFPALAKDLFVKSFGTRYSEIALSNYALACAMEGDIECAQSISETLEFWSGKLSPHSAKLHKLNSDIIDALSGDEDAQERLKLEMNGDSEYGEYLKNSSALRKRLPKIYEISATFDG